MGWSIKRKDGGSIGSLASIDDTGRATFENHTEETEYVITYSSSKCGTVTQGVVVRACSLPDPKPTGCTTPLDNIGRVCSTGKTATQEFIDAGFACDGTHWWSGPIDGVGDAGLPATGGTNLASDNFASGVKASAVTFNIIDKWISISIGGSNSGTVYYSVAANTGPARCGRVKVTYTGSTAGICKDPLYVYVYQQGASSPQPCDNEFDCIVNEFSSAVSIPKNGTTYNYLKQLYNEAKSQFYSGTTNGNGLPKLYDSGNFPEVGGVESYYGDKGSRSNTFSAMTGWLFALQLSELVPNKKNSLFTIGYNLGGYTNASNIFGYKFDCDPSVARMVASAIYAAMRGVKSPNVSSMRSELGSSKYSSNLNTLYKTDAQSDSAVTDDKFYTDLRLFMPTSPGPYLSGYTSRPANIIPDAKAGSSCPNNTKVDYDRHEKIITLYNLSNKTYSARTVQAIADYELCIAHMYGKNVSISGYSFTPIFGTSTIGVELPTDGALSGLSHTMRLIAAKYRMILQSKKTSPKGYGRLRPGCSWKQEQKKNSSTDDRRNVLCEITIQNNDGCNDNNSYGTYNSDGTWSYTTTDASTFCEDVKNNMNANSFPSGHSSGIWGVAMVLMELMPKRADKIMKAANNFALNRTISRWHWTSDTIIGRVLGSCANAVSHAASDYDTKLNNAKKQIS